RDEGVGKVADLICSGDGQIRYLDVELGGLFSGGRHVAVPVGTAHVDQRADVVRVTDLSKDQIKDLPDYSGDASSITNEYEDAILRVCGRMTAPSRGTADLYDQGRFYSERSGDAARDARLVLSEEELTVGKRQVRAGEAGLRKTVETEHVKESVPLVH